MIISHKFKYVFIQNARTASTSMGKELRLNYAGEKILKKHSLYSEFLKKASEEEKQYFVFTGQRNPLDQLVTLYFRYKYRPIENIKKNTTKQTLQDLRARTRIKKSRYIREHDLSFVQFFQKYRSFRLDRSHLKLEKEHMNFIYRYENLQQDFSAILNAIGIEQIRPLPQHSKKTTGKDKDFYQYYTPEIQRRVQILFGRSFKSMGYAFPSHWERPSSIDYPLFWKDFVLNWARATMDHTLIPN